MSITVDVHTHIGKCRVFDLDQSVRGLMEKEDENKVSKFITQPFPGAPDAGKVHDEIARLSKEHPGKVYGIVSLNPHMDEDKWKAEVERLVKDEGFVGIKIHTIGHAMNPLSEDANKVFEMAKKLKVPVMVHTGPGVPFAMPSMVLPRAKEYPDVPIILAHAGWGVFTPDALMTALQLKNIYVEPSHVSIFDKSALTGNLPSDRIMMGSDVPVNIAVEIGQFKGLYDNEGDLDKVLGENAVRVFNLK